MTRRRVVHLIDRLSVGGAETLIVTAAEQAASQQWDLHVISLADVEDSEVHRRLAALGVEPLHVPSRRRRTLLDGGRGRALRRVIRRLDPDVLHTHLRFSNILGPIATAGMSVRRVTTLHSIAAMTASDGRQEALERRALRHGFDARIGVGPTVATTQGQRIGRDVCVIPNPVASVSHADDALIARTREELLAGAPGPLLLTAGRLTPAKALPDLLRALALVRHHLRGATLAIAGDGELRGDLQLLGEELRVADHVRFLGARTDVPLLMRAADAFVLASTHEGLPLVVLEAMAAGCPVVATDVGDVAYALDGAGLLVPAGQYCELASAITRLLVDPYLCRRLGERGREMTNGRHTPEGWAGALDDLYGSVMRHG